jgi:tetratricopeptide (TPR) repeat protein
MNIRVAFENAVTLHQAGRLGEAEQAYQEILAVEPDHADSLNLIGVIALQNGRYELAIDFFGRAIRRNNQVANFHSNMGLALRGIGRLDDAVAHLSRTVALNPEHCGALNSLGLALKDQGKLEEAAARLRQALALKPDYAEAQLNLGTVALAQGRLEEAAAHYRRALAGRPEYADAHYNLATTLSHQGKSDEALAHFQRALAIKPDFAEAHYNLANVLRERDDLDAAKVHYERAIAANPGYADAYNNLGAALADLGRPSPAIDAYHKAIALSPRRGAYYLNLANTERLAANDPHLSAMEALAADAPALPEQDRIELAFALGKAYYHVGQRERSFQHLLLGNALKRKTLAYDEAATLGRLKRIQSVFDAKLLRAGKRKGNPSHVPVFIIGIPRSGTSLIEQILASHPIVHGAGEIDAFERVVAEFGSPDGISPPFPELVRFLPAEHLRQLGTRYLAAIRAAAPAAARIINKMPANYRYAGLIHLALPNARIIHVRRDPVDTCLSCFSTLFTSGGIQYSYDLGELGRYYRAYEALMAHWRKVLPAGVMLEVQYEGIVDDLETQARRIVAHCGLDWNERCLAFHTTARPVRTASAVQVRRPIYRSSVGRWRPKEELLQPLLAALAASPDVPRDLLRCTLSPQEGRDQEALVTGSTIMDRPAREDW